MATLLALAGPAAQADLLKVIGTSAGSEFIHGSAKAGATVLQLSFDAASFASEDSALPLNLGLFTLGPDLSSSECRSQSSRKSCTDNYEPYKFQVALSIGVPMGGLNLEAGGLITGQVHGRVGFDSAAQRKVGDVRILFADTPTLFTFTNNGVVGSFKFHVDDVTGIQPSETVRLTGHISDLTVSQMPQTLSVQRVPEPASIVLLGMMLLGVSIVCPWMGKRLR